jgi:peroxiredoxin
LLHVLRQNGRLLLRLDAMEQQLSEGGALPADEPVEPHRGLPLGAAAPEFALTGIHGETMTLSALRAAEKPVLLLFMDPGCGPCNALMPDVGSWQREHAAKFTLAVVTRGKLEANRAKSAEHGIVHVLLQKDLEASNAYQAHGTPSMVLVRADGTIGSSVAAGSEAIRKLVGRTAGVLPMAPQPAVRAKAHGGNGAAAAAPDRVGQPAPEVVLPNLDGKQVSLADLRGSDTLVLFWNPGCGFCQRMLPDLRAWESSRPPTAPSLLVISSGEADVNREQGIQAPVLLDQGFSAGRAFGVSGTPSAVLVDAEGKIASSAAVGAQSVLALAAGPGAAGRSA